MTGGDQALEWRDRAIDVHIAITQDYSIGPRISAASEIIVILLRHAMRRCRRHSSYKTADPYWLQRHEVQCRPATAGFFWGMPWGMITKRADRTF
jgi:hypothetical protein